MAPGFLQGSCKEEVRFSAVSQEFCSTWSFFFLLSVEIEGTVPTVLWFCYLLMHSSPLGAVTCWWKGEERGWGIFAECREYLDASIFPGYLELLEQNELAKNHYILNYIWILDGAISPSCRYKLGEALSLRTLRIHSTLSMRTASSFYLTSAKDVTRLAWE